MSWLAGHRAKGEGKEGERKEREKGKEDFGSILVSGGGRGVPRDVNLCLKTRGFSDFPQLQVE